MEKFELRLENLKENKEVTICSFGTFEEAIKEGEKLNQSLHDGNSLYCYKNVYGDDGRLNPYLSHEVCVWKPHISKVLDEKNKYLKSVISFEIDEAFADMTDYVKKNVLDILHDFYEFTDKGLKEFTGGTVALDNKTVKCEVWGLGEDQVSEAAKYFAYVKDKRVFVSVTNTVTNIETRILIDF